MNQLRLSDVQKELVRLANHYPESGHSVDMLAIIADDWFHDFHGRLSGDMFKKCVDISRRRCKFFPKTVDIEEAIDEINSQYRGPSEVRQIEDAPTYKTDEERLANMRRLNVLVRMITGEITREQADREIANEMQMRVR